MNGCRPEGQSAHGEAATRGSLDELRGPARSVVSFAELLRWRHGHLLNAEALSYLDGIEKAGLDLQACVERLMRSRRNNSPRPWPKVSPASLVRDLVEQARRASRVRFRVQVGALPACPGDPLLLREVFRLLLDNAYRLCQSEPNPLIEIDGRAEDDGVVFRVRDNGVGFDPALGEVLFASFGRGPGPGEYKGARLGLAIVADVVRSQGGRVWAEGSPGGGSSFYFQLPRSDAGLTGSEA